MQRTEYKNEDEWLAARRQGIGSSDASTVLGLNPWKGSFQLWLEKTGRIEPEPTNLRMRVGHALEDEIAREFEARLPDEGLLSDPGDFTLFSGDEPWMLATPDRLAPGALVELKTAGPFMKDQWEPEPPLYYLAQVQHQLMVTGLPKGYIAVLFGLGVSDDDFQVFPVERHDDFIDLMREREAEFWHHVESNTEPVVDESPATRRALLDMYSQDTGEEIVLPSDVGEAIEKWRELKALEKQARKAWDEAKASREGAEAPLWEAIRDATFAELPGVARLSAKTTHRKAYEVAESSYRVLRETKLTT